MNLFTFSSCPKLAHPFMSKKPDNADLAVHIALQLSPAEKSDAKKFMASSIVGL